MYVRFDPKKHKGLQLFELSGSEVNGMLVDSLVLSTVTFEQASKAPWNYSVETGAKDMALPQPILAKAISSKDAKTGAIRTAIVRPVVNALKLVELQPGPFWQKRHVTVHVSSKADATLRKIAKNSRAKLAVSDKGGPGSGFYGHAGRPEQVGGSQATGIGRDYIPLGLGTHELSIDDLKGQLPTTVGNDIADVHTKIGSPQIQYHVVPEGYTMSPPADSPMAFYRSLRKIGSSHEAMAADTTVQDKLKTLDDQDAVSALGSNKLLVDKSGVTARQAGRSAVHILKATFTGAALGAAEEAGRSALSEIRGAIRRGDADAIASFITRKVPKSDPAHDQIMALQRTIKHAGKFGGDADEIAAEIAKGGKIAKTMLDKLSEEVAKRSRASARTAAGNIIGGAKPKVIRRAVSGALGGAALGASGGAASLTGRGGVQHKYVLKQIRLGGQVTMGSGTWATILQKTDVGHVMHVYGID